MVVLRIGDLVSSFKQHFSLRDGGCGCCEEEVEFVWFGFEMVMVLEFFFLGVEIYIPFCCVLW